MIDDDHVHEPDALVRCGEPLAGDLIQVPDPLIVVEVLSPTNTNAGMDEKKARYWSVPSVTAWWWTRSVVPSHHRRGDDGAIQTRVHQDGTLALEPPGTALQVEMIFA